MDWLTDHKIPIGPWAKTVVDWLTTNLKFFFDFIALVLDGGIRAMLFVLQGSFLKGTGLESVYPLFMILVFTGIAWLMRKSAGIAAFTLAGNIRRFGHLAAQLDPLGFHDPIGDPSLNPHSHGLTSDTLKPSADGLMAMLGKIVWKGLSVSS